MSPKNKKKLQKKNTPNHWTGIHQSFLQIPMHKADSSQDYDQPGHHDTIQRGDASQLVYE
jgi:hypothetical protein